VKVIVKLGCGFGAEEKDKGGYNVILLYNHGLIALPWDCKYLLINNKGSIITDIAMPITFTESEQGIAT
jgi:hypothetical protein